MCGDFRLQKSAEESDSLREACAKKDEQIKEMKREIDRLLLDLGEAGVDNKLKSQRLYNSALDSNVSRSGSTAPRSTAT